MLDRYTLFLIRFRSYVSANDQFPVVNTNNDGFLTNIHIQNEGSQDTEVTLSYTPAVVNGKTLGAECTETQVIPAKQSSIFAKDSFGVDTGSLDIASDCIRGMLFVGSASVTHNSTNQLLAGVGIQLKPGGSGGAYEGFSPTQATDSVMMPSIMDRNGSFYTGFSIAHAGGPGSTINCTFSDHSRTFSGQLAEGGVLIDVQKNQLENLYVGNAICRASDPSTKIVAVVNQIADGSTTDEFFVYEAENTLSA
ncbi:MAG: hypothetical protein AAF639_27365 [Chloroflexota bacterium]